MKKVFFYLLLAASLMGASVNVQKDSGSNTITGPLVIGSGQNLTIASGGTLTAASGSVLTFASGILNWSSLTGTPTTIAGYGITDAVSTSGSYSDPSWITSLSATKLSGTIAAARMPAFTGDATSSAGAVALTLATVNSNTGSFGDATHVGAFTVNGKGLVTAAGSTSISIPSTAISDSTSAGRTLLTAGNAAAQVAALGLATVATTGDYADLTNKPTFNTLSPMTTLGDTIYGGASGTGTRLAGNTSATRNFLRQTGSGVISAAPAWDTLINGDIPTALTGKTYNALTLAAVSVGFTVAGGTTSKTLTVPLDATVSGTNTGDQTISITGDVTASGSTGALAATVTKINGVSLAGLATGVLKNTTTTGVPSIAVAATDYVAPGSITSDGITMATGKMLGRATASTGAIEEIATTGTGSAVLATTPTLVTPILGVAAATSINGNVITTGTGTLTLGAGKTASISNTLTFTGTDSSTLNVGAGGTLGTGAFQPQTVLTGTSGQISVTNSGVGATTVSIPSAVTGVNSITSASSNALVLATGTSGTALTIASATNLATFSGSITASGTGTNSFAGTINLSVAGSNNSEFTVDRTNTSVQGGLRLKTGGTNKWGLGVGTIAVGENFGLYNYGTSSAVFDVSATTNAVTFSSTVSLSTAGNTISIKSGSNAAAGTFTMVAGSATVTSTAIDASTVVIVSLKTVGGTSGVYTPLTTVTSGSFTATSVVTDTSTYNWVALKVN